MLASCHSAFLGEKMSVIDQLLDHQPIPRMVSVRQFFERPVLQDVAGELQARMHARNIAANIQEGMTVAIAVGSRGITMLPLVVKLVVKAVKAAGGVPFIVPCMGSHGGATAEGQKSMLIGMGINEEDMGAPIRATMETVIVGKSDQGLPVNVDRYAYEADGIIIINRIKPHVAFRGIYESGLMKMITIGLGKQQGADICHEMGFGQMAYNIPSIARVAIPQLNILFAVGIIENAYHEVCRVDVMLKDEIESLEPAMLEEAKRLSPRLFFDKLDVAIIDEIGKDISGTGFDTNFVGRYHTPYASGGPQITRIAVLDITNRSHGNGNGLGIADFTTKRAFEKFDFEMTYPNSLTSTVPISVKIPMVLKNDRQAIQAAIKTCNIINKKDVRLIRIKNTIAVQEIEVSENLLPEVLSSSNMQLVGQPYDLVFNENGNLF
jgi:hypothetical protein